jgi:hypothetical protein
VNKLRRAIHKYLDETDHFEIGVVTGTLRHPAEDGTAIHIKLVRSTKDGLSIVNERRSIRNSFLDSRAFGRILVGLHDTDEDKAVLAAVDLLIFLHEVRRIWRRILAPGSTFLADLKRVCKEATGSSNLLPTPDIVGFAKDGQKDKDSALSHLTESRRFLDPSFHRRLDVLIEDVSEYQSEPVVMSYLIDPKHLAKRGGARDVLGAFRGGAVRELDSRLPEGVEMRAATIASLLRLAGDPVIERRLARVLLNSKTPK